MNACPHCGASLAADPAPPCITVDSLRSACLEAGHIVLPGDRVRESTAAWLLDRAPATLANWRSGPRPIPFHSLRGRTSYHLSDLARFLNDAQRD